MPELAPVPPTPLALTLPRLEAVVSAHTGIVRSAVELLRGHGESRFVGTGCLLAATDEVLGTASVDRAGGSSVSRAASRAAAIGEAVERYAGAAWPPADLPRAAAENLGAAVVVPAEFTFFRAEQLATPGLTDAHSVAGLGNMELSVQTARRGWATAGDILNTRPLSPDPPFIRE